MFEFADEIHSQSYPWTQQSIHSTANIRLTHLQIMNRCICSPLLIALALLILGTREVFFAANPQNVDTKESATDLAEEQFLQGKAHADGNGVEQSWEKARHCYQTAAESGHTKAMVNLGLLHLQGKGAKKDEKKGYDWIHKASALGDPRAIGLEGYLLCEGRGCVTAPSLGKPMLEKGAGLGDSFSQAMLGERLLKSREHESEAIIWLEKAAVAGNGHACLLLGDYSLSKNSPPSREQAAGWYEKGAWLGSPACQFEYARVLMVSKGVASSYPWAKLAKEGGVPAANGIYWECLNAMTQHQRAAGDAEADRISRSLTR
jgi:TPR repeat protein